VGTAGDAGSLLVQLTEGPSAGPPLAVLERTVAQEGGDRARALAHVRRVDGQRSVGTQARKLVSRTAPTPVPFAVQMPDVIVVVVCGLVLLLPL